MAQQPNTDGSDVLTTGAALDAMHERIGDILTTETYRLETQSNRARENWNPLVHDPAGSSVISVGDGHKVLEKRGYHRISRKDLPVETDCMGATFLMIARDSDGLLWGLVYAVHQYADGYYVIEPDTLTEMMSGSPDL